MAELPAVVYDPERKGHAEGCPCARCVGLQPGHTLSLRHGSYSGRSLSPRAKEIEEWCWEVAPWLGAADAPLVAIFSLTMARIESAHAALAQVDEAASSDLSPYVSENGGLTFDRLRRDARAWARQAMNLADQLGMTPAARARLQLDTARTADTIASLQERGAALVEAREEQR